MRDVCKSEHTYYYCLMCVYARLDLTLTFLRSSILMKKARRKLMHLSLRLAFARTDCTPMTHCVPMGRNS